VHFVEAREAVADAALRHLQDGDLFLTLGAGDIWKAGEELLRRLAGRSAS